MGFRDDKGIVFLLDFLFSCTLINETGQTVKFITDRPRFGTKLNNLL